MTPEREEELRRRAEELASVAEGGGELVPSGVSAEEARLELAKMVGETEGAALELQRVTEEMGLELRKRVEEEKREMERRVSAAREEMNLKMREMREMMAPLEKQMARLKEGIWTVNLYLGSEEQLVQLADGLPAPVEEHVRVRQLVLAMDQEAAVAAEDGGIDSFDIWKFDEWLKEDWAHVEQVIPEAKGVVALVPRWDPKTHWGDWEDQDPENPNAPLVRKVDVRATAQAEEGNRVTYFLIRNGRRLYRVAMGDFYAGDRLMPSRGEWESFFEETNRKSGLKSKLVPGSTEWERAEKSADNRRRHYMRVGLILQGLADRTEVFNPVPAEGVLNFLAENEYVDFVMDADNLLGTGRVGYEEWLRSVNGELRPGERIVASFESEGFKSHAYKLKNRWDAYAHSRLYPTTMKERPETGRLYALKGRKGKGLYFNFPRVVEEERRSYYRELQEWRHGGRKGPHPQRTLEKTVAATCTVYPEDDWAIAYDRVSLEDVRYYLGSRTERHRYTEMFPVLKAVIRAKELEEEEEAPFRAVLAPLLARETGVPVERVQEDLDDLIRWYKFENRYHRPLAEDDAKATRLMLAEYGRRIRGEQEPMDETLVALLEDEYPDYLLIGRKRNGRYFVIYPQEEEPEGPFTHERDYYASGKLAEDLPWQLVGYRADRWRVALEGEAWASWDRDAMPQEYISLPERSYLVEAVRMEWGERLLGARFRRAERDFIFYVETSSGVVPAHERRLTGDVGEPTVETVETGWTRTRGRAVLERSTLTKRGTWSRLYGSNYARAPGAAPWERDKRYRRIAMNAAERLDAEREQEARAKRVDAELAYVNEAALTRLYARDAEVEAAKVEQKRLRFLAQAYEAQVIKAWEEAKVESIRAAFWEKHGDAAHHIWPTYRRNQVKESDLAWPYGSSCRHRRHDHAQDLTGALERVIEEDFDLVGLTVAQLADLAVYLSHEEPKEDAYEWERDRWTYWSWEAPEDVAAIVLKPLEGPQPTGEECPVCGEVHGGEDPDDYHEFDVDDEDPDDEPDDDEAEAEEYEVDGEIADEEDEDGES